MQFDSLAVVNLRCLERLEFDPAARINLIWGDNGSGKTSLLEGFALAAQGKSFLTNRSGDLLRRGENRLAVRAEITDRSGLRRGIGVSKAGGDTRITLDGQAVNTASVLARHVPLLVINSQAPDLLTGGPSNRRALLDRTMFHVEHHYIDIWKRYRRALRQRNVLLRTGGSRGAADPWNRHLVDAARAIDQGRKRLVEAINAAVASSALLEPLGRLTFDYRPGWKREQPLLGQLEQGWDRDQRAGHTLLGPHRADLTLRADGVAVGQRLSRGQCKAVICTVIGAMAAFVGREGEANPVLLIDDLAAELDDKTRSGIVDMMSALAGQQLYTAVKTAQLPEIADRCDRLFHVEHRRPATTV